MRLEKILGKNLEKAVIALSLAFGGCTYTYNYYTQPKRENYNIHLRTFYPCDSSKVDVNIEKSDSSKKVNVDVNISGKKVYKLKNGAGDPNCP